MNPFDGNFNNNNYSSWDEYDYDPFNQGSSSFDNGITDTSDTSLGSNFVDDIFNQANLPQNQEPPQTMQAIQLPPQFPLQNGPLPQIPPAQQTLTYLGPRLQHTRQIGRNLQAKDIQPINSQSTSIEPNYRLLTEEEQQTEKKLCSFQFVNEISVLERKLNDMLGDINATAAEFVLNCHENHLTPESIQHLETSFVKTKGSLKFIVDALQPEQNVFLHQALDGLHAMLNSGGTGPVSINGASHLFRLMGLYFDIEQTRNTAENVAQNPPTLIHLRNSATYNTNIIQKFEYNINYLPVRRRLVIQDKYALPSILLDRLKNSVLKMKFENWNTITNEIRPQFKSKHRYAYHNFRLLLNITEYTTPCLFFENDYTRNETRIWITIAEYEQLQFIANQTNNAHKKTVLVFTSLLKDTNGDAKKLLLEALKDAPGLKHDAFSITIPSSVFNEVFSELPAEWILRWLEHTPDEIIPPLVENKQNRQNAPSEPVTNISTPPASIFISPSTVVEATRLPTSTIRNRSYPNFSTVVDQFRRYVDAEINTFSFLYRKVESSNGLFVINLNIEDPLLTPFISILKECPKECRQDLLKKLSSLLKDFGFCSDQTNQNNSKQRYLEGSSFPDENSYKEVLLALLEKQSTELNDKGNLLDDHLTAESTMTLLNLKLNEMQVRAHLISKGQVENIMEQSKEIPCFLVTQDKEAVRLEAMTATFNKSGVLTSFNIDQSGLSNQFVNHAIHTNLVDGVINLKPSEFLTLRNSVVLSAQEKIPIALFLPRLAPPKGMIDLLEEPEDDIGCDENFMDDEVSDADQEEPTTTLKRERDQTDEEIVERKRIKASLGEDDLNNDPFELDLSVPNFEESRFAAFQSNNNLPTRRSDFNLDLGAYQTVSEMEMRAVPSIPNNAQRPHLKAKQSLPRIIAPSEPRSKLFDAEHPENFWSLVNASDELNTIIVKAQKLESQISALVNNQLLFRSTGEMDIEWEDFPNFNPTLKPYQRKAAAEICEGRKNILALSMGLGKTRVIAETIAQRIGDQKHLVIAPKSILDQLSKELNDALSESVVTAWLLSSEADIREYIENDVLNDIQNAIASFENTPSYLINLIRIFPKLYKHGFTFNYLPFELQNKLYAIVQNVFRDKIAGEIYLFVGLDYTALGLAAKLNSHEGLHEERVYDEDKIRNLRALGLNPEYTEIYKDHRTPNKPVIICTIKKIDEVRQNESLKFSTIVLDEAQVIHKHSTKSHKSMKELVRIKGNSRDTLTLLVTGTPYENSINELIALFEIAGRSDQNTRVASKSLDSFLNQCAGKLTDGKSTQDITDELTDLDQLLIKTLRQFYFFGVYAKENLINLSYSDPIVKTSWQGKIPSKEIRPLVCAFTDQEKSDLAKIISESKKAFQLMTNTSNYILRSDFFKRELLDSEPFKLAIEEQKKIIIVMGRHDLSLSLEAEIKDRHGDTVDVYPYHGKMNVEQRSETIVAFKRRTGTASVLLLMEKVGGVGLNLPEADVMFKISTLWNPGTAKQIEHRIVRVNNVGLKVIYEPKMDNDFVFEHSEAVRAKKETMDAFLFSTKENPQAIMKAWIAMLKAQVYHAYLIQTKEPNEAKRRTDLVEAYLERFENKVTEDHVRKLINLSL